ncbi:hypothetical protein BH10ACI4_BH10ACI4_12490 [soil metagenome]
MHRSLSLLLLFSAVAPAQQSPYVTGSTVSGHVVCGDTNAPARFAKVFLKSTAPDHAGDDFLKLLQKNLQKAAAKNGDASKAPQPQTPEQKRAFASAARGMDRATDLLNAATVALDGSYSFANIKPGTYYIHAGYSGYIDPIDEFSPEELASTDSEIHARVLARVPTVTVASTGSARADLRLDRGAVILGRILYDDGSPASGWTLIPVLPKAAQEDSGPMAATMTMALAMGKGTPPPISDDRGQFRIAGVAAGDYLLRASIHAAALGVSAANLADGGTGIDLAVYSGNTYSQADAKPFHLFAGEEHGGIDITIPSHALHNIIGHVTAKSDGHTLNSGSITLTSKDNETLHLKAAIRDDGSFHYEYLPPGTYTLTVDSAADSKTSGSAVSFMGISVPNQEITHKYGTATTTLTLSEADIDSIHFTLDEIAWTPPPPKATPTVPGTGLFE